MSHDAQKRDCLYQAIQDDVVFAAQVLNLKTVHHRFQLNRQRHHRGYGIWTGESRRRNYFIIAFHPLHAHAVQRNAGQLTNRATVLVNEIARLWRKIRHALYKTMKADGKRLATL